MDLATNRVPAPIGRAISGEWVRLDPRALSLAAAVLLISALAVRLLPVDSPPGVALRLLVGTLLTGVLPGGLMLLCVRPIRRLSLLEFLGLGTAVSLALSELITVLSL